MGGLRLGPAAFHLIWQNQVSYSVRLRGPIRSSRQSGLSARSCHNGDSQDIRTETMHPTRSTSGYDRGHRYDMACRVDSWHPDAITSQTSQTRRPCRVAVGWAYLALAAG